MTRTVTNLKVVSLEWWAWSKRLRVFVAQGSVGGAVGSFLLTLFFVFYKRNPYNFLLLAYLPIALIYGLLIGSFLGTSIWLPSVALNRRFGFLTRSAIAFSTMSLIATAIYTVASESVIDRGLAFWCLITGCFIGLPTGLMVDSGIHPWRILVFGLAQKKSRHDFSGWSGLLLRFGSLVGFMVSVLWLAFLLSLTEWDFFVSNENREVHIGTIFAVLYFTTSAYVSFTFPGKATLLVIAALFNVPLAIWTLNPRRHVNGDSDPLAIVAWVFIVFWLLLVVGRMISSNDKQRNLREADNHSPAQDAGDALEVLNRE